MIGNGGDGSGKVQIQLSSLAVGQIGDVLEGAVQEVVHVSLAHVVAGDDNSAHSHSGGVLSQVVGLGGDGVRAVVGGGGDQGVNVLLIQADQGNLTGGGQVGDRNGGSAGNHEGGVDLSVLQGLGGISEGLIGGGDVLLHVQAIDAQNVNRVVEHAGAGSADGDALALQVVHSLDAGVDGHDLDLLHVQVGHGGEVGHRAGLREGALAVVGIGHNVGLHEAQLSVIHVHVLDVDLRAAGGDGVDGGAGQVAHLAADDVAEAVVGAGLAAGGEGQVRAAVLGSQAAGRLAAGCGRIAASGSAGSRLAAASSAAAAASSQGHAHHHSKRQGNGNFLSHVSFLHFSNLALLFHGGRAKSPIGLLPE